MCLCVCVCVCVRERERATVVDNHRTQLMVEHSVKEICELITLFETGKVHSCDRDTIMFVVVVGQLHSVEA